MSSLATDDLTLADLPSDITRRFFTQDSVDDIRMISRHWNAVAMAFLRERVGFPAIKWFSWNVRPEYFCPNIIISRSNKKFFGIDDSFLDLKNNEGMEGSFTKKFQRDTGFEQLKDSLTKLFVRSSVVEHFIVYYLEELRVLKELLHDVSVTKMVFRGLDGIGCEHRPIIENIVKNNSIRNLHFHFHSQPSELWEMRKQDLSAFLNMCATLESTIELHFILSAAEMVDDDVAFNCWQSRAYDLSRNGNFSLKLTFNHGTVDMVVTPKAKILARWILFQATNSLYLNYHWILAVGSFQWNWNRLTRCGCDRTKLPSIKQFTLGRSFLYYIHPNVCIHQSHRRFFGLEDWNCESSTYNAINKTYYKLFKEGTDRKHLKNEMTKLFARCSHVEKLVMHQSCVPDSQVIKDCLRDVIVNELTIQYVGHINSTIRPIIMDFISTHSVPKLFMNFYPITSTSWNALDPEIYEFLKICAPLPCSFTLKFYEEIITVELRDRWQTRMDALDRLRNLPLTRNITANEIAICMNTTVETIE